MLIVNDSNTEFTNRLALMNASYLAVKDYDNQLSVAGLQFTQRNDITNLDEEQITVQLKASNSYLTQNYMLSEVNDQIVSSIFGILQYSLVNFTISKDPLYFIMQNTDLENNNYMNGLHETIDLYRAKGIILNSQFSDTNVIVFCVGIGFTFFIIFVILIIYMAIRRTKLYVMSFFIHIASKSLEEIITNCDEFLSLITLSDIRTMEPEGSEQEIFESDPEMESQSSMTIKQQQLFKGYKSHHSRDNRILSDSLAFICCTIAKFFILFFLVGSFFLSYFLIGNNYYDLIKQAGDKIFTDSLIELNSIDLLVLMKESISNDTNSVTLSSSYTNFNKYLNFTVGYLQDLEDVSYFTQNLDTSIQDNR